MSAPRWIVRGAGGVALLFGLILWSGAGAALVGLHQALGAVAVLALWVLAILALRAGDRPGLAGAAIVWALLTPVVGIAQTRLLPGRAHGMIQAVHLLLGLGVIAFGERLAAGAGPMAAQRREA